MTTYDHQRSDDPVVITTRDIYKLASETAGKVDSLINMQATADGGFRDHEQRIRQLERRFYWVIGTIGLGAVTLAYYFLERASG